VYVRKKSNIDAKKLLKEKGKTATARQRDTPFELWRAACDEAPDREAGQCKI
jgi:hypothetical protein